MMVRNLSTIIAFACIVFVIVSGIFSRCARGEKPMGKNTSVIFLHHSTGNGVWRGGMPRWIEDYNAEHETNYQIIERAYPSGDPYKWKNYPFDYWNIWINHEGHEPYMEEPTLETLTQLFDVIVWKHCFPVSNILPDTGNPDITSEDKRLENYKLQYRTEKENARFQGYPVHCLDGRRAGEKQYQGRECPVC